MVKYAGFSFGTLILAIILSCYYPRRGISPGLGATRAFVLLALRIEQFVHWRLVLDSRGKVAHAGVCPGLIPFTRPLPNKRQGMLSAVVQEIS